MLPIMSSDPRYFTYNFFYKLMRQLKDKGYEFSFFGEKNHKSLYLRHDLDFSLELAQSFALKEQRQDIRATYFVMLETEAYSARKNRKILHDIIAMGHDIGLHYVYENPANHKEKLLFQAECLSDIVGKQVRVFSVHRPASLSQKGFDAKALKVSHLLNTYHFDFFRQGQYISDSNHFWRSGNPVKFLEHYCQEMIQILIHPIWWTDKCIDRNQKVANFLKKHDEKLCVYFSENVSFLSEYENI